MATQSDRIESGAVTPFEHVHLARFVASTLTAFGLSTATAETAADFLLIADIRGVESRGIARLPYDARRVQRGLVNTTASLAVVRESASTLALDAQNEFALALAQRATAAGTGHVFMVWRIDAFRDRAEFFADVDDMVDQLGPTPPMPVTFDHVVDVPGDPELAAEAANRKLENPVRAEVVAELRDLAADVSVAFTLDPVVRV